MKRKAILILVCLYAFANSIVAGGNKTYYFKTTVTAAPSGAGKVYANTSNVEGGYQETITVNPSSQSASSTPTTNIYLWQKPNTGYTFINWASYTASFDGNIAVVEGSTEENFSNEIQALFIPTGSKIFQIENSNFESWRKFGDNDHAPDNWNSFETLKPNGSLTEMAKAQQVDKSTDTRPGTSGTYSVKIYSRSVVIANAQGNLTTGRINAGSTTPADKLNHNFTDATNGAYNQYFGAHPDAAKVWVKFVPENTSYYARVAITTHDAYNYITYGQDSDNTESNESHAYSHAARNFQATAEKGWQQLTIPFEFTGNNVEPTYIVVNFSTNNVPGGGSANDILFVDDLELVYYSELASATFNGTPLTINANGTIEDVKDIYSENKISLTSNGHGATIEKSYDEETAKLTVTVKGEDISENTDNFHTYTIQFAKKGDVNGDGDVTIADVTALVNIILGKAEKNAVANVNGDDDVTIADVTALVNIILGK